MKNIARGTTVVYHGGGAEIRVRAQCTTRNTFLGG